MENYVVTIVDLLLPTSWSGIRFEVAITPYNHPKGVNTRALVVFQARELKRTTPQWQEETEIGEWRSTWTRNKANDPGYRAALKKAKDEVKVLLERLKSHGKEVDPHLFHEVRICLLDRQIEIIRGFTKAVLGRANIDEITLHLAHLSHEEERNAERLNALDELSRITGRFNRLDNGPTSFAETSEQVLSAVGL